MGEYWHDCTTMEIPSQSYCQKTRLFNRVKLFRRIWHLCVEINYENHFHKVWKTSGSDWPDGHFNLVLVILHASKQIQYVFIGYTYIHLYSNLCTEFWEFIYGSSSINELVKQEKQLWKKTCTYNRNHTFWKKKNLKGKKRNGKNILCGFCCSLEHRTLLFGKNRCLKPSWSFSQL